MLKLVKFTAVLNDTKSIISFSTVENHRIDVSKKFIETIKDPNGEIQYVFTKKLTYDTSKQVPIRFNEPYIVECILTKKNYVELIQDIISVSQVNQLLAVLTDMKIAAVELW